MNLKRLWLFTFGLILTIPVLCLAHTPVVSNQNVPTLAPMLAKVTPAIVNIAVEKVIPQQIDLSSSDQLEKKSDKVFGVGSGVIIDAKEGLIVTNEHVIQNERIMVVTLKDGRRYRAGKRPLPHARRPVAGRRHPDAL